MRTKPIFLQGLNLLTSTFLISAALLAMANLPISVAGEQDVRNQDSGTTIKGVVVDERAGPQAGVLVHCSDFEDTKTMLGEAFSGKNGEFELSIAPVAADKIRCWIGGDNMYEGNEKIVPIGRDTKVVFILNFQRIPRIEGWITNPAGEGIHRARVQVTQSNGASWSRSTDENGWFSFDDLTAGPARVVYSANGYQTTTIEPTIRMGNDLSASLSLESFPSALLLLIPGIMILTLRTTINWQVETAEGPLRDPDRILIVTSLVIWGAAFFFLWFMLSRNNIDSLNFFHPKLSFPLFVPFFGFLGALIFVTDAFRTGQRYIEGSSEFAFRLVLGPYVAVVVLLLFRDNGVPSSKLETQATVAFFSGFLVVLVLQMLTEKGNEILEQWRSKSRYEPSELAVRFHLDMADDLKLREINLKYLEQLRSLPEEELRVVGRRTTLGEEFLVSLWSQLQSDRLQEQLGREMWAILDQEGVKTIWDVALLTPDRILEIANKHNLHSDILMKFYETCKATVREP
jgi:hypothetical protein